MTKKRDFRIRTSGWVFVAALFLAGSLTMFSSVVTIQNIQIIKSSWDDFVQSRSEKSAALSDLRKEIGFGGMIHQFKNYVLRHDESLIGRVNDRLASGLSVIEQYRAFDLDAHEQSALDDIQHMLDQYAAALTRTIDLVADGKSPEDIDALIQINDAAAIQGLNRLDDEVSSDAGNSGTLPNKSQVVARLRKAMGYGGMIHNFKNLVLRQEPAFLALTRANIASALETARSYQARSSSDLERRAIADIIGVINAYGLMTKKVELRLGQNYLAEQLDSIVAVDDTPALMGFSTLNREIFRQNKISETKVDAALALVRSVAENSAILTFLIAGILIVGALWLFRSQIIGPIRQMTDVMTSLAAGDLDVKVPATANSNEIGEMARAIEIFKATAIERKADILEMAEATKAAQAANLAKSDFLSTISHEIRTPLNGVLGLAQILIESKLDPDQKHKVETILSSGQTLLAILNDVLDMSKIEAGRIELEKNTFNLGILVSTITTPFQSLADEKGLTLHVEDSSGKPTIVGDPIRLRQILWNLLSNAIKFTESGSVKLAIRKLDNTDDHVTIRKSLVLQFSITDTGVGIPPDRVEAIFDAFTQADTSITRKHGGTGLGLSIVRQLTELMGGTIDAESRPGKGTVFRVWLPFDEATKEASDAINLQHSPEKQQQAKPLNVLLAEDNEINTMIATAFLEGLGHQVRHVENGRLAVEAAKEQWADLILMDVHMPEMNGIDATRAIRLTEAGKPLPIIGLTAEAFTERHTLFREAGMNSVITKPFTKQQLADTLALQAVTIDHRAPSDGYSEAPDAPAGEDPMDRQGGQGPTASATGETVKAVEARPAINEHELATLRQQLGGDTVSVLLKEAEDSLLRNGEVLIQSLADGNSTQIRETAHAIKGVSGSMYAVRVSELAAEIEETATDIDAVRRLLPAFELACREAIDGWRNQAT